MLTRRFGGEIKVRRILHLRLERRPVFGHEVTVHRRIRLVRLLILHLRRGHINQPPDAIFTTNMHIKPQLLLQSILLRGDLRLGPPVALRAGVPAPAPATATTTATTSTAATAARLTVQIRFMPRIRPSKRRFLPRHRAHRRSDASRFKKQAPTPI